MSHTHHRLSLEQLRPEVDPGAVPYVLRDEVVGRFHLAHGAGAVLDTDGVPHALLAVDQAGRGAGLLLGQEAVAGGGDGLPELGRDPVVRVEYLIFLFNLGGT